MNKIYEYIALFDTTMSPEELKAEAIERMEGLIKLEGWTVKRVDMVNMGPAVDATDMYTVIFYGTQDD